MKTPFATIGFHHFILAILSLFLFAKTSIAQTFTNAVDGNISNLSNWSGNPNIGGTSTLRWQINGTTEYRASDGDTTITNGIGLLIGFGNTTTGNLTVSGGNLILTGTGVSGLGTATAGATNSADGTLILSGGNIIGTSATLSVADRGGLSNGTLIINSGSTLTLDRLTFGNREASGNGTVTVNSGGTLLVRTIDESNDTTDVINFNGGTIKAAGGGGTWMNANLDDVNILANGVTFDSNGQTGQLIDAVLKGVAGGNVTITDSLGGGEVIFGADNTYDGDTLISAGGTLIVGNGGTTGTTGTGALTNNGTLVFNRSDNLLQSTTTAANISGGISSGNIEQRGSGTLTFDVDNSYSGTTLISGGTLQIGNGGTTGSLGTGAVINNSLLTFNHSNTQTVSNDISGTGGITKNAGNTVTLSGNNSYDGNTVLTNGVLRITNANALGSTTGFTSVEAGNAVLQLLGNFTVTGETLRLNSTGQDANFFGGIQAGPGNEATWTGDIILTGGGARAGAQNNGHLILTGNISGAQDFLISASPTNGKVTVSGSNNTYTGRSEVGRGTLALGANNTLPTSTTLVISSFGGVAGAILDLNGFDQTVGRLLNTNASAFITNSGATSTLTVDTTNSDSVNIAFSGNVALTKSNSGTLTLTSASSHTGDTRVVGGGLVAANADALSSSTLNMVSGDTGTVTFNQDSTLGGLKGDRDLDMQARVLSIGNNNDDTTYSGNLSNGNLTKIGSGTLTLSGNNGYTGATTVSSGILQFGQRTSLYNANTADWNATNLIVEGNATAAFNVGGAGEFTSADIDLLAGLGTAGGGFKNGSIIGLDTSNAGGSFTYSGNLQDPNSGSNSLGLTKLGAGTLVLTGNNTNTGSTTIEAGTLQVGAGATAGTLGSGNITNNGSLSFNRSDDIIVAGDISGTGALNQIGSGNLILTGTSSFTGNTTISSGTLQIGNGGTTGSLGANSSILANGTLVFNRDSNIVQGTDFNSISGSGTLIQNSVSAVNGRTLTLNAANSFSGDVFVEDGVLEVTHADALANANSITINAADSGAKVRGTLEIDGGINFSKDITINGPGDDGARGALSGGTTAGNEFSGTVTVGTFQSRIGTAANGNLNISGNIVGSTPFYRPRNGGTLTFSGTNNSYTGTVGVFGDGTSRLVIGRTDTLPTASGLNLQNSVTLDLNGFDQTLNVVSTAGTATITNDGASASTLTVNSGTVNGVISDGTSPLSITKQGGGTSTFNGTNSYSGNTIVSGGALVINGDNSAATGDVIVSSTLKGTGSIGGNVSINNGGTHGAAVSSSAGTQTLSNNLTYNTGSSITWDLIDASLAAGTGWDSFNVGGALDFAASGNDSLTFNIVDGDEAWDIMTGKDFLIWSYGSLTGFDPAEFNINYSGLNSDEGVTSAAFQMVDTGGSIVLRFTAVPEPGTYALTGIGLAAFGWLARRRRRRAQEN